MNRSKSNLSEGMTEKVVGKMKRVAGAVGRAARGALGRPEAGADRLFQVLHADHEEVAQLFEKVLASPGPDRIAELWGQLAIGLTAHSRAETQVVYAKLAELASTRDRIPHAIEEHDQIDKLLAAAGAASPGTSEFIVRVRELQRAVQHHVEEEEGTVLPSAALPEDARDELVARFQARKRELRPDVERELAPLRVEERERLESGDLEDEDLEIDESRTLKELQAIARERGIEGRSKMSKPQLVRALGGR